ncbi:hypothetical protein H6P81_009390 [Aristolochia fimbriata]|uniref:Uncharacterized protein n=1 Tax=Aristolochia fimbriata TaxID=158543 RepID=A0AAV7EMT5_ARIFI|nr:hypothetical protein H6P81_009390 [Aristolochia fimbriata]
MPFREEPMLSRFDRLDYMMGSLEELKTGQKSVSARSSGPSSPSSGTGTTGTTLTSDGGTSSVNSSPKSLEKRCRPMDSVLTEIRLKGSLIDRLTMLEDRVFKMGLQMEEEIESERKREEGEHHDTKSPRKKGLKSLVKSCVKGPNKHHHATD